MTPEELEAFKGHVKIEEHSQFRLLQKVVTHIDSQAAQIKALKEALIEEKASGLFNGPWDDGLPDNCGYDAAMNACRHEAEKRLRDELPEVSWDE